MMDNLRLYEVDLRSVADAQPEFFKVMIDAFPHLESRQSIDLLGTPARHLSSGCHGAEFHMKRGDTDVEFFLPKEVIREYR